MPSHDDHHQQRTQLYVWYLLVIFFLFQGRLPAKGQETAIAYTTFIDDDRSSISWFF
jgi:hypothetical protein